MKPCGTRAAYMRHLRNGETACGPCLEAEREYQRNRYTPATGSLTDCEKCGAQVPSQRRKYCSEQCAYAAFVASDAYARAQAKRNSKERPKVDRTCVTCGRSWRVDAHSKSKYCGSSCIPRPARKPKPAPKPRVLREPKAPFSFVRFTNCAACGRVFCSRYTVSTCSAPCKRAKVTADRSNAKHRRRALRRDAYLEPVHWRALYQDDGPSCYLCGFDTDPSDYTTAIGTDGRTVFIAGLEYPSVDHVVALSQGGSHSRTNARLAHMYCNSVKCAQSLESVA